jgi:hypothetical protein
MPMCFDMLLNAAGAPCWLHCAAVHAVAAQPGACCCAGPCGGQGTAEQWADGEPGRSEGPPGTRLGTRCAA